MIFLKKYWWALLLLLVVVAAAYYNYRWRKALSQRSEDFLKKNKEDTGGAGFYPIVTPLSIRQPDAFGSGAYQASRGGGTRKHLGLDLLVQKGQAVHAPFDGYITRKSFPYPSEKQWEGFVLENDVLQLKAFYCVLVPNIANQLSNGKVAVKRGQQVANMQGINEKYGKSMQNHIHVEIREGKKILVNPEKYLFQTV